MAVIVMSGNSVDYKQIIQSMQNAWVESGKDGDYSKLAIAANKPIEGKNIEDQIAILKGFIDAARAMIPVFKDTAINLGIAAGKATGKPPFVIAAGQAFLKPGKVGAEMLLTAINTELALVNKKQEEQSESSEQSSDATEDSASRKSSLTEEHPKPILFDYDAPEDPKEGFKDAISSEEELNALHKVKEQDPAPKALPEDKKRRSFFRRS
jgi:hypothetical protein